MRVYLAPIIIVALIIAAIIFFVSCTTNMRSSIGYSIPPDAPALACLH